MAKFCKNCGAPLDETTLFCPNCGTRVEETPKAEPAAEEIPKVEGEIVGAPGTEEAPKQEAPKFEEAPKQEAPKFEEAPKQETSGSAPAGNKAGISERNIALAIVFSIITCGIYGLYWLYKLNDEINQLVGDDKAAGGGMVILLTLVTCGIYGWYWFYKMGEKVDRLKGSDSNKILFIVLGIFGLGIINYAIMQDTINKEIA